VSARAASPKQQLLWIAVLTHVFSGCSYLFVTAPPDNHERLNYFDCTQGNGLPVIDTVLGGIYALASVGELSGRGASQSTSQTFESVGAPLVLAGLFAASAVSGFGKTSDCRMARTKLMVRLDQMRVMQPYPPPATPDPWLSADPPFAAPLAPPGPAPRAAPPAPARRPEPSAPTETPPAPETASPPTPPEESPAW